MNTGSAIQAGTAKASRQETKAQLDEYMVQQPASKQAFDKWMKALEIAGLGLIAGAFALALYVSINYTAFPGTTIAAAWFAFPASAVPLMIVQGVRTVVLKASLPFVLTGKPQKLVTGSKAMWSGLGLIAIALLAGAFWGTLAWAAWSFDVALIGIYVRILSTAMAVIIPAAIVLGVVSSIYRQFVRSR